MNSLVNKTIQSIENEFSQDMRILSKVAATKHPMATFLISRYMELYIQKKVDMELTKYIYNIFM
jgi:hypothetical protein